MSIEHMLKKFELFHKYTNIETTVIYKEKIIYCSFELKDVFDFGIYPKIANMNFSYDKVQMICHNSIECFGVFKYIQEEREYLIIVGPILTSRPLVDENLKYLSFYHLRQFEIIKRFVALIPQHTLTQFAVYLELVFLEVTGKDCSAESIIQEKQTILSTVENDDFSNQIILDPKETIPTSQIGEAIEKYIDVVRQGDLAKMNALFNSKLLFHQYSTFNSQRNLYNIISLSALLGKAAVDAGCDFVEISALGSSFIQIAENFDKPSDFVALFKKMILGFTNIVHQELNKNNYSKSVKKAINYIDKHIHYPISLEEISDYVKLSRPYLSQMFSKEVGVTIQSYIQDRKMSEAENLIKFSKMSIAEVAASLSYCSQSYFTEVFKRSKKMTPLEYRKKAVKQ